MAVVFSVAEDERLSTLNTLEKVRVKEGLMSAVPAGMIVGAAMDVYFNGAKNKSKETMPSAEEWQTIANLALAKVPAIEESRPFKTFCGSPLAVKSKQHASLDLARYLTLYLPTECSLQEYWPRANYQEVVDQSLANATSQFKSSYPAADAQVLKHIKHHLTHATIKG